MVVVGIIVFPLFLDIDGQSIRLRGPAINWWLFFYFEVILQIITLFLYELDDRYYKKISATRK